MRKRKAILVVLAAAALTVAAMSAGYLLSPAVLDQGGGVASSSSYQMRGSVGGPVIAGGVEPGTASSANYNLDVNTLAVLETGAKEEPHPDNGGCGAGAALVLAFALGWTRRGK